MPGGREGKPNRGELEKIRPGWPARGEKWPYDLRFLRKMLKFMDLLNGAADRGKNVVSVRSDQSDCAYDYRQDDGQHDRIFGNVLPCFFPQAPQKTHHV